MEEKVLFDVSVVLPIESAKYKDFSDLFNRAVESIKNQSVDIKELIVVHSKEEGLVNYLNGYDFKGINTVLVLNEGTTDFSSQVNLGVEKATSTWVSILEFDDEYSSIWFKNAKRYSESYTDVDCFLPLVVDTDEKGTFAGFTNEATFAVSLTTEMGYLTNDVLLTYQNFQTSGMVVKRDTLINNGGFKPSFKLTFVYELLLRLTYNSVKIMSVPRIGYKHTNMREGSIFWNYKFGESKITDDEVKFWLDSAKKEHFFTNDRNIKYEPQNV